MRRPWIVWSTLVCLLLIGTTLALAKRSREVMQVSETNGYRHVIVRKYGLFPVVKLTPVPGLDVTADFKRALRRQGLRLPAKTVPLLSGVSHTVGKASDHYSINGRVAGSMKAAVDDFVPLGKGASRLSRPDIEQLNGTCVDGKTSLLIQAHKSGGSTYLNVYFDIPR